MEMAAVRRGRSTCTQHAHQMLLAYWHADQQQYI